MVIPSIMGPIVARLVVQLDVAQMTIVGATSRLTSTSVV